MKVGEFSVYISQRREERKDRYLKIPFAAIAAPWRLCVKYYFLKGRYKVSRSDAEIAKIDT